MPGEECEVEGNVLDEAFILAELNNMTNSRYGKHPRRDSIARIEFVVFLSFGPVSPPFEEFRTVFVEIYWHRRC